MLLNRFHKCRLQCKQTTQICTFPSWAGQPLKHWKLLAKYIWSLNLGFHYIAKLFWSNCPQLSTVSQIHFPPVFLYRRHVKSTFNRKAKSWIHMSVLYTYTKTLFVTYILSILECCVSPAPQKRLGRGTAFFTPIPIRYLIVRYKYTYAYDWLPKRQPYTNYNLY